MNAKIVHEWACGKCGKQAATMADAEACCKPKDEERVTVEGDMVEIEKYCGVFKFNRADNSVFIEKDWLTSEQFAWMVGTRAKYFNNSL